MRIAENLMSGLSDVFKAVSAVIIDAATPGPTVNSCDERIFDYK